MLLVVLLHPIDVADVGHSTALQCPACITMIALMHNRWLYAHAVPGSTSMPVTGGGAESYSGRPWRREAAGDGAVRQQKVAHPWTGRQRTSGLA